MTVTTKLAIPGPYTMLFGGKYARTILYTADMLEDRIDSVAIFADLAKRATANDGMVSMADRKALDAKWMEHIHLAFRRHHLFEEKPPASRPAKTLLVRDKRYDKEAVRLLVIAESAGARLWERYGRRKKIGPIVLKRFAKARAELQEHLDR